jgi:hypothetical protein
MEKVGHTHTIANITSLQTTLDGKAASSHTHTLSQITDWTSSMSSGGTRDLFFGQASTNNNSLRLRYYWEANNSSKNRICIGFPNNTTDNNPIHIDNSRVQINTNLVCDNISSEAGGTNLQDQLNGKLNTSALLNMVYPVGSIYTSVVNTSPASFIGGTWVSFGAGRCIFGVDTSQTEFNTVQKTGGEKTHVLTEIECPPHTHNYDKPILRNGNPDGATDTSGNSNERAYWRGTTANTTNNGTTSKWGGIYDPITSSWDTEPHNNLPPYITVYMWRRTA